MVKGVNRIQVRTHLRSQPQTKTLSMNLILLRVTDPRSGARLCEAQQLRGSKRERFRGILSMIRFMATIHVQYSEAFPLHEVNVQRSTFNLQMNVRSWMFNVERSTFLVPMRG